ncbi:regulator [Methylomonas sp. AM2-LC]|uniref:regulator n=1 Tax=Methylomonas sp. AM2-LC TaxID=3153301 RepID=UPI00326706DF
MIPNLFDDSRIAWQTLAGIEHLHYSILDIDEQHNIIDVLFKFAARQQIVLHRHKVLNKTFVIQGEHILYHADGQLKEVRAVGSYTSSEASQDPHREGGGDIDVIVLFSIRGSSGVLYEILDAEFNVIATLGMQDFVDLYHKQRAH